MSSPIDCRASAAAPCAVCGSPSKGCSRTADGLHLCRGKPADPAQWRTLKNGKPDGSGFRLLRHKDDNRHTHNGRGARRKSEPKLAEKKIDWAVRAKQYARGVSDGCRAALAANLKLPEEALRCFGEDQIGARGRSVKDGWEWTIPERNGRGEILGIAIRHEKEVTKNGQKTTKSFDTPGGHRGLCYRSGLNFDHEDFDGPLLLVEGFSDAAAACFVGIDALGRPASGGGLEHLVVACRGVPDGREIILCGENDEKENGDWPGRDGAVNLAQARAETEASHLLGVADARHQRPARMGLQYRRAARG